MTIKAVFKDSQAWITNGGKKILLTDSDNSSSQKVFVVISETESGKELFILELSSSLGGALFRGIEIWHNYVVIGFERYTFLFDIITEKVIEHPLKSYFNNFFITENKLFICSASNINYFGPDGSFIWRSEKLGSEQITISNITNNAILGSGKWAENGEWQNFIIDIKTGSFFPKRTKKKSMLEKFFHWRKLKKTHRI